MFQYLKFPFCDRKWWVMWPYKCHFFSSRFKYINCAIHWQCDRWLQFPSLLHACDNISDVCANQNEVPCHAHCLPLKNPIVGWALVEILPGVIDAALCPSKTSTEGRYVPILSPGKQLWTCATGPWPQRHPSSLMLQTFQARCCFDLGPQQKISLGKSSHDSWAPQWKLSVDNIEKIQSSKFSREGSMKETRCVLRIQLERNETVPDSVTFLKIKNKKESLKRIAERVSIVVVLISPRPQFPPLTDSG